MPYDPKTRPADDDLHYNTGWDEEENPRTELEGK